MRQETFENINKPLWIQFEQWLDFQARVLKSKDSKRKNLRAPDTINYHGTAIPFLSSAELPETYRKLCQHLALAETRGFSLNLTQYLHRLVQDGHNILYRERKNPIEMMVNYIRSGFASDVRREWKWMLASAILFFGPYLLIMAVLYFKPSFLYIISSPSEVHNYREMYAGKDNFSGGRAIEDSVQMFGFYIFNNIGIAFRSFVSGLFFGIGTLFVLVYNGIAIGAVEGDLVFNADIYTRINFLSFVAGHSTFELGAIVISGGVGLRLGVSLLIPGQLSRMESLRNTGKQTFGIMMGCLLLLTLAAAIEAFWSPSAIPATIKLIVGPIIFILTCIYFIFAGRQQ